jgi:hypothetical protein
VARHYIRTSCAMLQPANTLHPNTIEPFKGLKMAEDHYIEPSPPPVLEKIERIRKHIETLDAHLLKTLGLAKTPLAYVVREDHTIVLGIFDPANGYETVQEEMIARCGHEHPAFQSDNIKVWEIIRDSVHKTEAYHWIKGSERRRDGRGAYLSLTTHYLGVSNI